MKLCEASMPKELGKVGIEVGKAGIESMVEERAMMEKRRKVEFIMDGIRRKYFQAESLPGDVLNFGRYAGRRFAEVWALCLVKILWKLNCFKFFLRRLLVFGTSDGAGRRTGGNGKDNKGGDE